MLLSPLLAVYVIIDKYMQEELLWIFMKKPFLPSKSLPAAS